eukprot:4597028-Prymnesium_polylepis.1
MTGAGDTLGEARRPRPGGARACAAPGRRPLPSPAETRAAPRNGAPGKATTYTKLVSLDNRDNSH